VVAQNIGFAIIAVTMVVGALRVVTTSNVVHAALWLVVVLSGAAAQYVLLGAEFVAITQVLVYVGAVMVLFLFGIMLTRSRIGREGGLNNPHWKWGIPVALLVLAATVITLVRSFGDERLPEGTDPVPVQAVGDLIFGPSAVLGALVRALGSDDRSDRAGEEGLTCSSTSS
jgi:NADH-quinone oxidoreductase subunit J